MKPANVLPLPVAEPGEELLEATTYEQVFYGPVGPLGTTLTKNQTNKSKPVRMYLNGSRVTIFAKDKTGVEHKFYVPESAFKLLVPVK